MGDTLRQRQAVDALIEAVSGGYPEEDPGLRDRFRALPRAPIRIICCEMDKGINHGNILRIADAYRVESVTFSPVARRKQRDYSGAYAALRWVPFRWVDPLEAVLSAKGEGFHVYGLSLAEDATPLRKVAWSHPAALVLGQELDGLPEEIAGACGELVAIPMYGMITSMNVAVSCALAVDACFAAFAAGDASFAPARRASADLLGTETQTPAG